MSLLLTAAILTCAVLAWRLHVSGKIIRLLVDAARTSRPAILPAMSLIGRYKGLDDLATAFNALLEEKANITGAGRAYHDQIQTLLGNLREAVVMVDRENRIRSANPSLLKLVGIQEVTTGIRFESLIHGSGFMEFLKEVQMHGHGYLPELKVRINGVPRWLEISAAALNEKTPQGNSYTLYILHDITRQKQLEKMRTEFVANVSHELRTPVTIIKGFAETLMEDDTVLSADEKRRFLDKISRNSDRLHRLLEDLMLLSRLESAEMILHVEKFSLNEFLEDFAENLGESRPEQSPRLQLQLSPDTQIHADPLRLGQVLHNLLDNAYLHAKGATRIILRSHLEDGWIKLAVEDDGPGIPEKDLPHIFQRFFRVDKGRSRESGGTGLGLSIVKHIMARHGGKIDAWSKMGQGTRIECSFPLHPPVAPSSIKQGGQ